MFANFVFSIQLQKNKPKIGDYEASFEGSYIKNGQTIAYNRSRTLSIIKVNSSEIHIAPCSTCVSNSILKKDNINIVGVIMMPGQGGTGGPSYPANEINISGVLEKRKGGYCFIGTHNWIYTDVDVVNQEINHYSVTGSFEIKPL